MKTITLQDFHEQVKKLAAKKGKLVAVVKCELSQYSHKSEIEFSCYVEGYSFYSGKTTNEALSKLRSAMFPSKQPIPNVEVAV